MENAMKRLDVLMTLILTALGIAAQSCSAGAQEKTIKQQLVGAWTLAAVYDQRADGTKNDAWGPGVQGSLMLSPTGRFSYFVVGANREKAGNDPRNNPAGPVLGYYGSYAADESAKTLTFHIEHATFPQWDGINRTATIELLTGDKLRIANSVVHDPKLGDIVPHLDWQRIK
jgi:hypothetical protein